MNNIRLEGATHSEAVGVIKSSPMLIMIVRYVGKVPQVPRVLPLLATVNYLAQIHAQRRRSLNSQISHRINRSVKKQKELTASYNSVVKTLLSV